MNYNQAYYAANKEKILARTNAYYHANSAAAKANRDAWRKANPDRSKASVSAWKKANPERVAAHSNGVDPNTVTKRPVVCEACGGKPTGRGALHLDHNHATGKFRGWLCHHCNAALGLLGESVERMVKLAAYLERA